MISLNDFERVITIPEVPRSDIEIELPIFEMEPWCGYTDEDFIYTLIFLGGSGLPKWISFNKKGTDLVISRIQIYKA